MTDHLEAAAESIRQHLHDRPWVDEPHLVYAAAADMQDITRRLAQATEAAGWAVREASRSDDGRGMSRVTTAAGCFDRAREKLLAALDELTAAQNAASHLIWEARS